MVNRARVFEFDLNHFVANTVLEKLLNLHALIEKK